MKRTVNETMLCNNSSNMNFSSLPSSIRPNNNSFGSMKSNPLNINSIQKSNSISYASRYVRKSVPMSRNIYDKNIRGSDEQQSSYRRKSLSNQHISSENPSFTIETSADDDETDDIHFSIRHMTAAHFQRNQRLLCEIFNEVCVPDLRSNINVDHILTLRREVNSLKTNRETFEKDLNQLEEKHAEKKRKFSEANEKFYAQYTDASTTNLTQEKINEILQKYENMEKLQKEKEFILQQQQQQQNVNTSTPLSTSIMKNDSTSNNEISNQQTQLSSSQSVSNLPVSSQLPLSVPFSQPVQGQISTSQSVQSQITLPVQSTHPMQQIPSTSQGYRMMYSNNDYVPSSGYPYSQPIQYQSQINQRPTHYLPNVQWQQQQWYTNTYDPRYCYSYPSNFQWSSNNYPQQHPSQMRVSSQMYPNNISYGYNNPGWNGYTHLSQSDGYSQSQQQYYLSTQIHDYIPSSSS